MSRIRKSIETKNRLVIASGWGDIEVIAKCTGLLFEAKKMLIKLIRVMVAHTFEYTKKH